MVRQCFPIYHSIIRFWSEVQTRRNWFVLNRCNVNRSTGSLSSECRTGIGGFLCKKAVLIIWTRGADQSGASKKDRYNWRSNGSRYAPTQTIGSTCLEVVNETVSVWLGFHVVVSEEVHETDKYVMIRLIKSRRFKYKTLFVLPGNNLWFFIGFWTFLSGFLLSLYHPTSAGSIFRPYQFRLSEVDGFRYRAMVRWSSAVSFLVTRSFIVVLWFHFIFDAVLLYAQTNLQLHSLERGSFSVINVLAIIIVQR